MSRVSTRNAPKEIRDFLKEVALELGYDYCLVEDVYYQQFEFIANQISSGERDDYSTFENILVKHFGSFIANERHVNKLKEINEAKKQQEDDREIL